MAERICSREGCDRQHYARGLCKRHYDVESKHGRLTPLPKTSFEERFWSKVEKTETCWLWTGALTTGDPTTGYGSIKRPGRSAGCAHRIAYEALVGPIPEGMELDHLCRVRRCVNPAHLEPVTHAENLRRGVGLGFQLNAAKTHCPQGHPYDEANTFIERNGARRCRTCTRIRQRRGHE